jgi:hypothetical protein
MKAKNRRIKATPPKATPLKSQGRVQGSAVDISQQIPIAAA